MSSTRSPIARPAKKLFRVRSKIEIGQCWRFKQGDRDPFNVARGIQNQRTVRVIGESTGGRWLIEEVTTQRGAPAKQPPRQTRLLGRTLLLGYALREEGDQ